MDNDTFSQQVRAAQGQASSPVRRAVIRDELLAAALSAVIRQDNGYSPTTIADAVWQIVDKIMVGRDERTAKTMAEIEKWAQDRLHLTGVALVSSGEALAATLLRRFGSSVEIPLKELEDVARTTRGYSSDVDEERGVIRFGVIEKPRDDEDDES